MAKIVTSKFGDRGLVHLPPVALSGKATPQVQSIAPQYMHQYGGNPDAGAFPGDANVLPKEYAYIPAGGRDTRNVWLGQPEKGYPQGNIVQPEIGANENGIGNHMFNQLVQQQGYPNYPGYPVGPGVSGAPQHMHYTPHALSSMAPAQQPVNATQQAPGQFPQAPGMQPPPQQPQYGGQPNAPFQPQPNEKHIYYGPDGEIIPGPPPGFQQRGGRPCSHTKLHDFTVDGQLRFGHLKAVKLVDPMQKFPVFPEYLLKDLKNKYGQYETTCVRIISRGGEIHIHATPALPGSHLMGQWPSQQYVPVYIDEDEYFGNHPVGFTPGPNRAYGTPPPWGMRDRGYNVNVPRPPTEDDPLADLRWRRGDDDPNTTVSVRPVERSRTNFYR